MRQRRDQKDWGIHRAGRPWSGLLISAELNNQNARAGQQARDRHYRHGQQDHFGNLSAGVLSGHGWRWNDAGLRAVEPYVNH